MLEAGDALVFDNRRILHAREAFDPASGPRHLRVVQMERDEFYSRLQLVARKGRSAVRNGLSGTLVGRLQPGRHVAVAVQDAPDFDHVAFFRVEDEIRKLLPPPVTQSRQPE